MLHRRTFPSNRSGLRFFGRKKAHHAKTKRGEQQCNRKQTGWYKTVVVAPSEVIGHEARRGEFVCIESVIPCAHYHHVRLEFLCARNKPGDRKYAAGFTWRYMGTERYMSLRSFTWRLDSPKRSKSLVRVSGAQKIEPIVEVYGTARPEKDLSWHFQTTSEHVDNHWGLEKREIVSSSIGWSLKLVTCNVVVSCGLRDCTICLWQWRLIQ